MRALAPERQAGDCGRMLDWNDGDRACWRGAIVEIRTIDRERETCTVALAVSVAQLTDAAMIA